jgi:transcriptional regulator with XRE-family HTH domain
MADMFTTLTPCATIGSRVDPIYLDFGRLLRSARRAAALSQHELGERVGLSRTSITNIERGSQPVALHTFILLAAAVGIPAAELLPTSPLVGTSSAELNRATPEDRELILRFLSKSQPLHEEKAIEQR